MSTGALADSDVAAIPKAPSARHTAGVACGNALEFYDFLTFAFFATQIGRTFFPSDDPTASLLASLATFGAGFLTRPLGALVIGRMGDRVGRKPALVFSFSLIGFAVLGMALTPSYAAIGIAAPVLVICFRLLQGFAVGGEVGASFAYLAEVAPPHRRGLVVSLQYVGQDAAVLTAGLVGVALSSMMSDAALDAWGWRVAFLIGATIIPLGLYLRRTLPETLEKPVSPDKAAVPPALRTYLRVSAIGFFLLAAATMVSYVLNYLTTYSINTLGMASNAAFGATVVVGACGVLTNPIGGLLSDRFGRKPMMVLPWLFLLLAAYPAFVAILHFRTAAALYLATASLVIPLALSSTSAIVSITESLPARVRSGSLALIYALAISVFGGSTQFTVTWLIKVTGDPLAPAWYMVGSVLLGLVAMLFMRETAPARAKAQINPASGLDGSA